MKVRNEKLAAFADCFLFPWGLVVAFAYLTWFHRVYDGGFKYKPYVLDSEFQTGRVLIIAFGTIGWLLYERLRGEMAVTRRVSYFVLVAASIALVVLDSVIARFIPPFFGGR